MRLTTIGTGTAAPSATRVSAGHLVDAGGVRLLMDCGSGVVHRMAALGIDWMGITHVALTHFDADHVSDLPTLLIAWRWGALPARTAPAELIGPPGTQAVMAALGALFGRHVAAPEYPFTLRELPSGAQLPLGHGVTLEARKVPHTEESIAYCVRHGTHRVVYTGDTGPDPSLAAWARGADVLLTECSLPDATGIPSHLTPRQCAELAAAAEPRHLVLTHFYPPVESEDIRGIIAERYPGPVTLAADGWTIEIEDN
jgi:ribonuclease BN (tRNA processing enzyme)